MTTLTRSKQLKSKKSKSRFSRNQLDIIQDDTQKAVIPIGPRFQADFPAWTGAPCRKDYIDSGSNIWLGIRIWPNKDKIDQTEVKTIGQGKRSFCLCASPGSNECVNLHISDKRLQLKFELGGAFWEWKFDEMGEDVSKFWNTHEKEEFNSIIKRSSPTEDRNFIKLAMERFPTQQRDTIVRYYFNAYVPSQMKIQTRLGYRIIDTDDDEDGVTPCPENSRKRFRADGATQKSCKQLNKNYLNGRR